MTIQAANLSKAYASRVLFDNAAFSVAEGEKIGLVGRNGHGKTTLLRLIAGVEEPDEGSIISSPGYRIASLAQHLHFTAESVLAQVSLGLRQDESGVDRSYRAKAVLQGLGFSEDDFQRPPMQLSGGFQVRLNLAAVLLSEPDMLLLDEPTNYLDLLSLRWLSRFLARWPHELIMVTHDHGFMDAVCTHTMGLHRGKLRKMQGGTAKYYAQIAEEEEVYEQTRLNQERQIKASADFVNRFRAKAAKASVVQSRIKLLEKIEPLKKLAAIEHLDFRFKALPFPGKWLLEADSLTFGYDPEGRALIDGLSFAIAKNDRLAVIGKNGKGKTTLIRLLARELEPDRGHVAHAAKLQVGYFGQTNVGRLRGESTVEEEIMSADADLSRGAARNICGMMMFSGEDADKKISVLSGGERSRVLLGKLLVSPANCLFLDEPTNHLDQESTAAFVQALEEFPGAIVIVTHSEMILRRTATRLIVFDSGQCFLFEGGYEDFLQRVGWQQEEESEAPSDQDSGLNKKELRKKRAEIIMRRSKETGPLRERMAEIESRIEELEQATNETNARIISAAAEGNGRDITECSRNLHVYKNEIELLFCELDRLHRELQARNTTFEAELSGLAD